MDFSITPEQQQLYASMKRLAAEVVAPGAAEHDKDGRWDPDVWKRLAEAGVAGHADPRGARRLGRLDPRLPAW